MDKKNKVRVTIDLERDVHKTLKLIAVMREKDMSQIVKELIEELIARGIDELDKR